jgi:hypothetical protein
MKSSPVAALLWIATLGVVAGGAYFVISTDRQFRTEREEVAALGATYRAAPADTWDDLKQREDAVINFVNVALTPGAPGVIPVVRPLPGPGDNAGPPKPVEVNLIPILDALGKQLETMIKPQPPGFFFNNSASMQAAVKIGAADGKVFLYEGLDLTSIKGASDQKAFELIVVQEIQPSVIVVAATAEQLRAEIVKAETTEQGRGHLQAQIDAGKVLRLDNGEVVAIFRIETGDNSVGQSLDDMISRAVTPENKLAPGGPRPAAGANNATTELPKPEEFVPLPKEEPAPANVEIVPSRQLEDGSWELGSDVLNQATLDDLSQYAETSTDANGQQNGIRIGSKLPADNSNAAYRMGARPGDVIKAINGVPVRNMPEIRAVVSRQRNEGVTRFVVSGERNGVPTTQTFTAPPLKK